VNINRISRLSLVAILLAGSALQARAEGPAPTSMLIPKVMPTAPTVPQLHPVGEIVNPTTARPKHLGHIVHSQNLSQTAAASGDTEAAVTEQPLASAQPTESKASANPHTSEWNDEPARVMPMSMMVVPAERARARAAYNSINPFVH
jgi:hypothetical protein